MLFDGMTASAHSFEFLRQVERLPCTWTVIDMKRVRGGDNDAVLDAVLHDVT